MTSPLGIAAGATIVVLALSGCSALTTVSSEVSPTATTEPSGTATSRNPQVRESGPADWTAVAEKVSPAVVAVSVRAGDSASQGSGVVLDDQGHIITNHHVVAGRNAEITVTLSDNRVLNARLVGTDPATDLAVLQVEDTDLTPLPIGDDARLRVGDPVLAVGNPLGLAGTVTSGMVSALNRPVTTVREGRSGDGGEPVVTNAVQTDAAINPGNSGGALVNTAGELVGINSSIATMGEQSGSIGIGFAITATQVTTIVDQLIQNGTAEHSYLGVVVTDAIARADGARIRAAGIARVESGTPAADAGLRTGDAVTMIDGEEVDSGLALTAQVRERKVGTRVTLSVARDGTVTQIPATLGTRP